MFVDEDEGRQLARLQAEARGRWECSTNYVAAVVLVVVVDDDDGVRRRRR